MAWLTMRATTAVVFDSLLPIWQHLAVNSAEVVAFDGS